jgi:nucleoid-associated protein YgaU
VVEIVQTFDEQAFEPADLERVAPMSAMTAESPGGTWRGLARGPVTRSSVQLPVDARGRRAQLHLTKRGRWVLSVVATVLAVGTGMAGGQAVADGRPQAPDVVSYTVQPGDTLWELASRVGAPGQDIHDVIFNLERLNGLPRAELTAGQQLVLPRSR